MAKGRIEFNTFVKGLMTEAGPLTYPEGASLEEQNFVLNRDGSRQRRFGIDFEENHLPQVTTAIESDRVLTTHSWDNPGNSGGLSFLVVQDGEYLRVYNANSETISREKIAFSTGSYLHTLTNWDDEVEASTTSIDGELFIVGSNTEVVALTYDVITEQINVRTFSLEMRDLWGVDDGLGTSERPDGLSHAHYYNLRNQGWPSFYQCLTSRDGDGSTYTNPIPFSFQHLVLYPSNSDLIHMHTETSVDDAENLDAYSPWRMRKSAEGTSEAPRGSMILDDIWNRGAARTRANRLQSDVSQQQWEYLILPSDRARGRITSVASYAGRLFYSFKQDSLTSSDDRSPSLSTVIAYSQVGTDNAAKCYTKNDLASESFNDVLDTDGGFVTIPEVGEVYDLQVLGDSLFVIASNGVWEIHGGEKSFSATNQSQSKVSNIGAISRSSVIVADDALAYWARSGIQTISLDKVSLRGTPQNITQATIQTAYDSITPLAKRQAVGVYDETSRQLRWLYRTKQLPDNKLFNTELVFDLNLGAFYTNHFGDLSGSYAYPVGYVDVQDVLILSTTENVTAGGVDVTAGGVDVTTTRRSVSESVRGSTKYLSAYSISGGAWSYTVAQLKNLDFNDWPQIDGGVDSPAYLLTGFWTGGTSSKDKRMPYLFTHFRRTEQGFDENLNPIGASGCLVRAQWEWTESLAAGKWGTEFQAYKLPRFYSPADINDPMDYGYTVVTTKNKVRGSGPALSLLFTTEPGLDCHIYGWITEIHEEEN